MTLFCCPRTLLLSLLILLLLGPSQAHPADGTVHTYDLASLVADAVAAADEKDSAQDDVSFVAAKYFPAGRPKEEVFLALRAQPFVIKTVPSKQAVSSQGHRYGEAYTASHSVPGTIPWLSHRELRLILYFNDGFLAGVEAFVFTHSL